MIVVPKDHPIAALRSVSLENLAAYPLITYDVGFTGRGHIDAAFREAGIEPDIVLTAMDSDVIQQYVSLGLGVGIVASMALERNRTEGLQAIEVPHLFAPNVTRLAVRRGAYLRSYTYEFILRFAPGLKRKDIENALNPGA
jgi:LysR family cys regulon transcriptional activator